MGKGSDLGVEEVDKRSDESLPTYTWEEIKNDKMWIVIDGFVYDITNFSKKHPGGPKIIKNHIGQDASVWVNVVLLMLMQNGLKKFFVTF